MPLVHKFVQGLRIGPDIFRLIRHTLLPKELFSCAAIRSTRLMVQHNLPHDASSFLYGSYISAYFHALND